MHQALLTSILTELSNLSPLISTSVISILLWATSGTHLDTDSSQWLFSFWLWSIQVTLPKCTPNPITPCLIHLKMSPTVPKIWILPENSQFYVMWFMPSVLTYTPSLSWSLWSSPPMLLDFICVYSTPPTPGPLHLLLSLPKTFLCNPFSSPCYYWLIF